MQTTPHSNLKAVAGAAAMALAAAACHPLHLHHDRLMVVLSRLDCPVTQGLLTRVSAAPDGNSCVYQHRDGDDITLTRLPLNGQSPQAALAPFDTSLTALMPPPPAAEATGGEKSDAKDASDAADDDDNDDTKVDVPGVHIQTRGADTQVHAPGVQVQTHGEDAQVNAPGLNINTKGDKADLQLGQGANSITVHDGGEAQGAQIHIAEVNKTNARLTFVLSGAGRGPNGYRSVGYLARGPVTGPLVVVVAKSRGNQSALRDHDVRRLLDLNVTR
jgi:hypothetical protein